MRTKSFSTPLPHLVLLAGAAGSIMLAGTEDAWAIAVFLAAAGLAMFLVRPLVRPATVPLTLIPLFCGLALLAFLPQEFFPAPEWRRLLTSLGTVPLGESVNPQPWLGWFWWWLLAGTCVVLAGMLAAPLESKSLALVLHGASLFVATYASLAIFASQTGWKYPFHGGAIFGFLPNKNHTASLLVVGSVLSFGLMQWRLARGDRGAAVFAALCGAPALAGLLFFSNSRAGIVFLAVGLAVWSVGAARSTVMRQRILAAVAILAVFLGLLFVAGGSAARDRIAKLWKDAVAVQVEGEGEDIDFRQPIFRDTTRLVADFPFTGTGLGQFCYVFPQYRHESARAARVLHPESDWVMVAAETGIPSVLVLAALAAWFVIVCWNARQFSGGMLRWTAASAVLAAVLHGLVDVPWHRVSLSWFLATIAVAGVPSSDHAARRPGLGRFLFGLVGLALLGAAGWIGYEKLQGRSPAPYRWPEVSDELQRLGEEKRYEDADQAAQTAVREFPLRYESYYWQAGHLRAFADAQPEIRAALQAARTVEPILPKVAEEQAIILQPVDPDGALQAWLVAIKRFAALDAQENRDELPTSGSAVGRAIAAFKDDKARQLWLARQLEGQPALIACWISHATKESAEAYLQDLADEKRFLESLPPGQRGQVLGRWITLPDAPRAVAFMEEREALSGRGEYWPWLSRYYASQGDLPRAVQRVAASLGVSLQMPKQGEDGLRGQMGALVAQGNTVAARRLAKDAVTAGKANPDDLSAAMSYYAAEGDWNLAWRAASRLASDPKLGQ